MCSQRGWSCDVYGTLSAAWDGAHMLFVNKELGIRGHYSESGWLCDIYGACTSARDWGRIHFIIHVLRIRHHLYQHVTSKVHGLQPGMGEASTLLSGH